MRSVRTAVVALLVIGLLLACGNLWTAAARSTILSTLNGTVTEKETRFEKHKGKDDVYLVWLDGKRHQVDQSVYESVELGDKVEKQWLSRTLNVDSAMLELTYSRDTSGMLPAMALVLTIVSLTGWYATKIAENDSITVDSAEPTRTL